MTTRYLDLVGGNNSNDGSTFALRKLTLASATSGLTGGDTVRVMASPDPTSLGQNATLTNGSDTVTLTTAVTANIDDCETAWTASANVTATASTTTYREGTKAASLVVASGFTTGLIAYRATGTLDLSAYQQVSFLIRSTGAAAAGLWELRLCSDTAGVTAVNTVVLPAIPAGYWTALVFDTAAALGSAIQSVALYGTVDVGGYTVFLDNIIACKASSAADSLTHYSLISKNTGTEPWMAIDSINGTTVKLGGGYQATASRSTVTPYYYGVTATQTLYKREPVIITAAQTSVNGVNMDSPLSIECGWDRTAMTTQDSLTFVRIQNPSLDAFAAATNAYGYLNKWYSVNAASGFIFNMACRVGEIGAIACNRGVYLYQSGSLSGMSDVIRYGMHCINAIYTGSGASSPSSVCLKFTYMWGCLSSSSTQAAVMDDSSTAGGSTLLVIGCDVQGHYSTLTDDGLKPGVFRESIWQNCTLKNLTRDVYSVAAKNTFINCTNTGVTQSAQTESITYYVNQNGDTTNHKILFGQDRGSGSVVSDTSTRHTASDFAWKLISTSGGDSYRLSAYLSIAKVACIANEQRTVTAWLRRDSTSLVTRLRVKGGLVSGILNDVVSNMTAAINTWEQVTIQFTPTQQCVVEVFAECYGATANAWVDDLGVS